MARSISVRSRVAYSPNFINPASSACPVCDAITAISLQIYVYATCMNYHGRSLFIPLLCGVCDVYVEILYYNIKTRRFEQIIRKRFFVSSSNNYILSYYMKPLFVTEKLRRDNSFKQIIPSRTI